MLYSRRVFLTGATLAPLVGMLVGWPELLLAQSGISLEEKSARRQALDEQLLVPDDKAAKSIVVDDFFRADYDKTPVGKFLNVDKFFLRWAKPDWFEYIPDTEKPLSFVRSTGEAVTPGRMFTDGGSIPRWFWISRNLSPWAYAPAYLVHDWEFDRHRAKLSDKDFSAVRDTLAEGVKTLMELGLAPRDEKTFRSIYAGVSSFVARKLWDG